MDQQSKHSPQSWQNQYNHRRQVISNLISSIIVHGTMINMNSMIPTLFSTFFSLNKHEKNYQSNLTSFQTHPIMYAMNIIAFTVKKTTKCEFKGGGDEDL